MAGAIQRGVQGQGQRAAGPPTEHPRHQGGEARTHLHLRATRRRPVYPVVQPGPQPLPRRVPLGWGVRQCGQHPRLTRRAGGQGAGDPLREPALLRRPQGRKARLSLLQHGLIRCLGIAHRSSASWWLDTSKMPDRLEVSPLFVPLPPLVSRGRGGGTGPHPGPLPEGARARERLRRIRHDTRRGGAPAQHSK